MSVSSQKSLFAESKKRAQERMRKKRSGNYLFEVKEELKKVSWTSKEELKTCTKIVIGSVLVLGLGIYVVDLFLKGALNGIGKVVNLIGG